MRNAFIAYEALDTFNPASSKDLLKAHQLLMAGLIDAPGKYRTGSVGVAQGEKLVHLAPPAERVPQLMNDLLNWLRSTNEHPLVASCVFHYELEFIHPFTDGNGRIGRLWQTCILRKWKSLFAYLPVETIIRDRQSAYYSKLAEADRTGQATAFVEFMLEVIEESIRQAITTDQVSDQVSDQVKSLLQALGEGERSSAELMKALPKPNSSACQITPASSTAVQSLRFRFQCSGYPHISGLQLRWKTPGPQKDSSSVVRQSRKPLMGSYKRLWNLKVSSFIFPALPFS